MNKLRKAVFLDRDGVLNEERSDYVKSVEELVILDDIASPIKQLKENDFLVVVISNQSAINRGLTTSEDIEKIHSTLQEYLKEYNVQIDAFYYCPHRPEEHCNCRKPKPGMLEKAANEMKIDLKSSWMIGDRDSDMEAAQMVGCKSIKITDRVRLSDAVQSILNS